MMAETDSSIFKPTLGSIRLVTDHALSTDVTKCQNQTILDPICECQKQLIRLTI